MTAMPAVLTVRPHGAVSRGDVGPAEESAAQWLVRGLALVRVAQLLPAVVVLASAADAYDSMRVVTAVFVAETIWAICLFGCAFRRGGFTRAWMIADIVAQVFATVTVGVLCADGLATQSTNWSLGPVLGASILASLFLRNTSLVAATALLLAAYLVGVASDLPESAANAGANLVVIAAFTWAAAMVGFRLLSGSRRADLSSREAAEARQSQALLRDRLDQFLRLHDTVLSTLEGIAFGGLEHASTAVRERCAADARVLRNMGSAVDESRDLGQLPDALAHAVRQVEALGLTVELLIRRPPHDLPIAVADAAAGAVREALNNVQKHANVAAAIVQAVGTSGGGISIHVIDRGTGFDPDDVALGTGLTESIEGRWRRVGGEVKIVSSEFGTDLELIWTPQSALLSSTTIP